MCESVITTLEKSKRPYLAHRCTRELDSDYGAGVFASQLRDDGRVQVDAVTDPRKVVYDDRKRRVGCHIVEEPLYHSWRRGLPKVGRRQTQHVVGPCRRRIVDELKHLACRMSPHAGHDRIVWATGCPRASYQSLALFALRGIPESATKEQD